jgi:hypothetical protein
MKKKVMIGILGFFVFAFCTTDMFAGHRRSKSYQSLDNFVTFSFFIQPASLGYKHRLTGNMFLTGNVDYVGSEEDLLFQTGAAYMIPRKILFFRLYGGGGVEFSRNHGYMYPYVMAGSKFWFLYAEIVHPMQSHSTPNYRFGFSFSF